MNQFQNEELTISVEENIQHRRQQSQFRECKIIFDASARNLFVTGLYYENCELRFKKKMSHFSFDGVKLINCKIIGKFRDLEIGEHYEETCAELRNCDFSDCVFESARIHNVALSELKLPTKDHVLITAINFDSDKAGDLNGLPGDLEYLYSFLMNQLSSVKALCSTTKYLAKIYKVSEQDVIECVNKINQLSCK